MKVTLVYALADRQLQFRLELPDQASVADAIHQSGITREFPDVVGTETVVGIHGVVVGREASLSDGDRVEIYRPLQLEAKEARRARLKAQRPVKARPG